jgi:heat shock protein HslJ
MFYRRLCAVPLALLLSGCAGAFGTAGTAAQIKELVKDKSVSCTRVDLMTPWGSQRTTATVIDKGSVPGNVTINGDTCDTTITAPSK